jgi:hypothetical protein
MANFHAAPTGRDYITVLNNLFSAIKIRFSSFIKMKFIIFVHKGWLENLFHIKFIHTFFDNIVMPRVKDFFQCET